MKDFRDGVLKAESSVHFISRRYHEKPPGSLIPCILFIALCNGRLLSPSGFFVGVSSMGALPSACRSFLPSSAIRASRLSSTGVSACLCGTGVSPSIDSSPSSSSSDGGSSGCRVFFFLGQRLGRTICWTRGSTQRSSNHWCIRASTNCAILGTSCNRARDPTSERTDRSSL